MKDPSREDELISSIEFHAFKRECDQLLEDIYSQQELVPNRPASSVGILHVKNLSTFQLTYMELQRWLLHIRSLFHRKCNTSLCRSESCLQQQEYLHALGTRETELNRLRALGEALLRNYFPESADPETNMGSNTVAGINIADQLDEINRLWQDTTARIFANYGRDQLRCLRYIELDIQEIEAQLRSINRCTSSLKRQLTEPLGTGAATDLATLVNELKVQHASLKQALRVLSSAGQLLNLLLSATVHPVIRGLAATVQNSASSSVCHLQDSLKIQTLRSRISALIEAGYDIWLSQIELREQWKNRFPNRVSTDMKLPTRQSVGDSNLVVRSSNAAGFPVAPLMNNWFPSSEKDNLMSELKIVSPVCRLRNEHIPPSSEFDQCSPISWSSSPVCKESGFGSASDGTTPSTFSPHINGSLSDRSQHSVDAEDASRGVCTKQLDSLMKPRSLSLDCLRSMHAKDLIAERHPPTGDDLATLTSDDIQAVLSSEHDDNLLAKQRDTAVHRVRCKSLPDGIGTTCTPRAVFDCFPSGFSPLRSSSRPALCASTPHTKAARSSDFKPPASCPIMDDVTLDLSQLALGANQADLDDSTFSDLLPSNTEANSGSMNTPMSLSLFSPSTNKPTHMGEGDVCMDKLNDLTGGRRSDDGRQTANNELEWDDSGDIRGMTTTSASSDSGFGLHSSHVINGEIPNPITANGTPDTCSWNVCDTLPPSERNRRSSFTFAMANQIHLQPNHHASWHSFVNGHTDNEVSHSPVQARKKPRTRRTLPQDNCHANRAIPSSPSEDPGSISLSEKLKTAGSSETLLSLFTGQSVYDPRTINRIRSPDPTIHNSFLSSDAMALSNGNACLSGTVPTSSAELVHLLESIRQDARPLIDLLCRLERGLVPVPDDTEEGQTIFKSTESVHFEQERVQLDIDRSFLKYYDRCLDNWTSVSDDLCRKYGVSPSSSFPRADNMRLSMKPTLPENPNRDTILVVVFADWLTGLKARHAALRQKLDSRALWLDQLAGLGHEVDQSLSVLADRVKNAVGRACSMIQSLRSYAEQERTPNDSTGMFADHPVRFGRNQVLETLGELRDLRDQVSTVEVRFGASQLMDETLDSDYPRDLLKQPSLSNASDLSVDLNGSLLNTSFDSLPSEGTTHLLFRQTANLKQRLKLAIKRLERAAVLTSLTEPHSNTRSITYSTPTQTTQTEPDFPNLSETKTHTDEPDGSCFSSPPDYNSTVNLLHYLVPLLLIFVCALIALILKFPSFSCSPRTDMSSVDISPNWLVRHVFCFYLPTNDRHVW